MLMELKWEGDERLRLEGLRRDTGAAVGNRDAVWRDLTLKGGVFSPPHPPKHFALIFASGKLQ